MPDGLMQAVLQIAHARAHPRYAPAAAGPAAGAAAGAGAAVAPSTYESASTAGFKHGRTEVARPATAASQAAVAACLDPAAAPAARFAALAAATVVHRQTTTDALMGQGVDRHLFALQTWAQRLAGKLPSLPAAGATATLPLFDDPAYAVFKDIRLSTSTLASSALASGGFGPVSRHSYAVGYGIEERGAYFHVMNYSDSTTSNAAFCAGLDEALALVRAAIAAKRAAAGPAAAR